MNTLINIGNTYDLLNRIDSARSYAQQAYDLSLRLNNIEGTGILTSGRS